MGRCSKNEDDDEYSRVHYDAYFRYVIDMGVPGPDKGKGGNYLILPPDYEGELESHIDGKAQVIDGETYFVDKTHKISFCVIQRKHYQGIVENLSNT